MEAALERRSTGAVDGDSGGGFAASTRVSEEESQSEKWQGSSDGCGLPFMEARARTLPRRGKRWARATVLPERLATRNERRRLGRS
jgi:hypothetical protein